MTLCSYDVMVDVIEILNKKLLQRWSTLCRYDDVIQLRRYAVTTLRRYCRRNANFTKSWW